MSSRCAVVSSWNAMSGAVDRSPKRRTHSATTSAARSASTTRSSAAMAAYAVRQSATNSSACSRRSRDRSDMAVHMPPSS
jgi:hypothetical protein